MTKEDNKQKNKKILGAFCGIVIIIFLLVMLTGNNQVHENTTTKEHITVKEFDFDRYGLPMDSKLYGWITGTTSDGKEHTYYVTKDQMAGLYYSSGKTFEFNEGLDLTYHRVDNGNSGNYIVDHIYLPNGTDVKPVGGEDSDVFAANSVQIGKNCKLCSSEFGMISSEV